MSHISKPITQNNGAAEGSTGSQGLLGMFERHPILSATAIWVVDLALFALLSTAAKALLPNAQPDFVALFPLTLAVIVFVAALRWWREVGFTRPVEWRDLRLLILPSIVIAVPPIAGGLKLIDNSTLVYLLIGYLLTGVHEEALYRGVLQRVLQPLGPRASVLVASVMFALAHLTNILVRSNPAIVLAQAIGAFCDGFGFAALRYRTNTIWFLILLHMLHDLLLQWTQLPLIALDVAQVTVLLIYGIYILRRRNTA